MKPVEVRAQIAAGQTGPLYLLEGDDLQSRHDLASEFAALVEEGLQAFNVESFYANEAASAGARDQMIGAILATARTLPMMAPRRVVVIHEAERLISPKRSKEEEAAEQPALEAAPGGRKRRVPATSPVEELEAYLEAPEPMTTLVFVAGPLDGNRRLVRLLRKRAAVVDCGSLESSQEAGAWIRKRLEKDELSIEPKALALLLEATGLGRIRAEVEKLVLYAAGESAVTERHVRDLVMPQSEPGEGPAVGMAIRDGDARRALQELAALLDAGVVPQPILGQIRWGAGQLRPAERVKRALDLVLDIDLKMKTSAGNARHLLERLVVELCGRERRA
ncbi:MAG: DNA polymerase III subunit delta [Vicinamibacterales bacterium]